MVGINYELTDRTFVRGAIGYYLQSVDGDGVDQMTTTGSASFKSYTIHQFGGSVAALYRLYEAGAFSFYTGPEIQYLYAKSDRSVTFRNTKTNNRFSVSELVGVKLKVTDWLQLFGEAGFGYINGMHTNSTSSFTWMRTTRWGFTHAGPGLEVQF